MKAIQEGGGGPFQKGGLINRGFGSLGNYAATHIKVILPLVLANLLQDGQILLFDPVVFRLFAIYRLLFFHVVMVQVLVQVNVLLPEDG